jgi:hypothetical protein
MENQTTEDTTFLAGLHEFWANDFPKTCPKCSRVYDSFADFITRTTPSENGSGVAEYELDSHEKSVGIFRNCACGSTLMILGSNRRDTSEIGEKRREIFGAMLDKLISANVPPADARARLLKVLYSGNLEGLASRLLGPQEA